MVIRHIRGLFYIFEKRVRRKGQKKPLSEPQMPQMAQVLNNFRATMEDAPTRGNARRGTKNPEIGLIGLHNKGSINYLDYLTLKYF